MNDENGDRKRALALRPVRYEVRYAKPPRQARIKPGPSGKLRGRAKARKAERSPPLSMRSG
jgi:hypothetical protein